MMAKGIETIIGLGSDEKLKRLKPEAGSVKVSVSMQYESTLVQIIHPVAAAIDAWEGSQTIVGLRLTDEQVDDLICALERSKKLRAERKPAED